MGADSYFIGILTGVVLAGPQQSGAEFVVAKSIKRPMKVPQGSLRYED